MQEPDVTAATGLPDAGCRMQVAQNPTTNDKPQTSNLELQTAGYRIRDAGCKMQQRKQWFHFF